MQALNELNDLVFRRLEDIKSPDQAFKLTAELVPLFQFKDKPNMFQEAALKAKAML